MTHAFDGGAFDSVAFDVDEEIQRGSGGVLRYYPPIKEIHELTDEEVIIAWFMTEET